MRIHSGRLRIAVHCLFALLLLSGCWPLPTALNPADSKVTTENAERAKLGIRKIGATWFGYRMAKGVEYWSISHKSQAADKTIQRDSSGGIEWEEDRYSTGRTVNFDDQQIAEEISLRYDYRSKTAELSYLGDDVKNYTEAANVSGKSLCEVQALADIIMTPWGISRQ